MAKSATIQECIVSFLADGQARSVQNIKAHLTKLNIGNYSEGQFAGSINTLQRNGKIKKLDRGVYSLRTKDEEEKNMKTCFVVSPIGNANSEIRKNADKLLKYIIKPVCEEFNIVRADQAHDAGSITQTILENLETADLVIADLSGHNPNVFYEMGFRQRTGKPIIHLKKHDEIIPFDVSAIRTFDYDLTDLDSVESIKERLRQTISSFSFELEGGISDNPEESIQEKMTQPILPILYQILDAISDLRSEVSNIDHRALQTAITTMQSTQPKMSQEDMLLAQLMPAMIQNPSLMKQLIELGEKYPAQQKNRKSRH